MEYNKVEYCELINILLVKEHMYCHILIFILKHYRKIHARDVMNIKLN